MASHSDQALPEIDGRRTLRAIRRCLGLLDREERRRWSLLLPFALLAAALEAGGAVIIFTLIRFIAAPESLEEHGWLSRIREATGLQDHGDFLIGFSGAVAVFYLVKNVTLILQTYYTARAGGLSVDSLTRRLMRGYLYAPYTYHLNQNSADLIRNTNDSVVVVYRGMLMALVHAASEAALQLGLVVVLIFAAPAVTLVAIGSVAVLVVLFLRLSHRGMVSWGYESHLLHSKMLSELTQSLSGIKEVKVLGRERSFVEAHSKLRARMSQLMWRRNTLENAPRLTMETFFVLAVVLVILIFEYRGSSAQIVPVLGLFAYAGFRVFPGMSRIVAYLNQIRFGSAAIDEIYDDAHRFGGLDPTFEEGPVERLAFERQLELRNVTFTYTEDRGPALRDIDLVIRRGESIGIVGMTGAGKSTFVDLLLGLLEPQAGTISVDDVDIADNPRGWRANVGYVPQSIYLVDDTLARNIALGIPEDQIDLERVEAAVTMAQLDALVARLPERLQTTVGERGVRLSGGERQRIAIARALYHQPSVLVFDEATSSLDNKTEREITRAVESFRGERTVIVIAHRLSTVKNCDRILFLEDGRVLAQGPYDQLVADNPAFRELAQPS